MTEPQQQLQSSDDSSGESRHVAAQPQYGQRIEPEYGARRMSFRRITTLTYMEASPSSRLRRRSRRRLSRPPCSEPAGSRSGRFRSQCGSGSGWARPRRSPTEPPRYFNGIDSTTRSRTYLRALGFLRHILVHLRPGVLVPGAARADRLPGHLAHPSFPYAGPRTGHRGRRHQRADHHHRHMDDDARHIDGRHVPGHAQHAGARHGRKRVGGLRFGVMGRVLRHASR